MYASLNAEYVINHVHFRTEVSFSTAVALFISFF
jgi:hypothetical protein